MYCVYITYYYGDQLPPKYIGSSSIEKIKEGYLGSVSSLEYKERWEYEKQNHPELFETEIVSTHHTRVEALEEELHLQRKYDVVESKEWINKSYAIPNGFFGMDVSGKNNPMYGRVRKGEKHKGGENISKALQEFFDDPERSRNHRENSRKMLKKNNPMSNPEVIEKNKMIWKQRKRNVGEKNGMYGKTNPMKGKKLYNNGKVTKCFEEGKQPSGWSLGRHKK